MIAALGRLGYKGKGGGKGKSKGGKGGDNSGGKGGQAPETGRKCINCGSTQHTTQSCTKPELPREKRPCWKCGKPGHLGADCRSSPRLPAKLVDDEDDSFVCGMVQGKRGSAKWPKPAAATIWNYVEHSMGHFKALEDEDDDESAELECQECNQESEIVIQRAGDIVQTKIDPKHYDNAVLEFDQLEYYPPKKDNKKRLMTKKPTIQLEPVAVCDWGEDDEEDDDETAEINAAEEVVDVYVALDSGTVEPVINPAHLPSSTQVVRKATGRGSKNFVGANGSEITNYGQAEVDMVQESGKVIAGKWHVADVTRPLHSTGRICDAKSKACPEGHEVLYTGDRAVVLPAGAVSKYLSEVRQVATYHRTIGASGRGGLYVAKMKLRASQPKSGFTRQESKA